MCKAKRYKSGPNPRIDKCMKKFINCLNYCSNLKILACCCGHKKYPMSIVADVGFSRIFIIDLVSGKHIPRKRKFYKRDEEGIYYIPEVVER